MSAYFPEGEEPSRKVRVVATCGEDAWGTQGWQWLGSRLSACRYLSGTGPTHLLAEALSSQEHGHVLTACAALLRQEFMPASAVDQANQAFCESLTDYNWQSTDLEGLLR
jgi:hypothetical protein